MTTGQGNTGHGDGGAAGIAPLHIENRRYLGAKTRMLDFIEQTIMAECPDAEVVADIFAGTGVVAHRFQARGLRVIVNDLLYSNYVSYDTWFGDGEVDEGRVRDAIAGYNACQGIDGYVTANFGGRYFSVDNARRIDEIREDIERRHLSGEIGKRERDVLLTSLLYAIDKVANTVGHYDAYRKKMDSFAPLAMRLPDVAPHPGNDIRNMDANELVREIEPDVTYIDPPYNSRGYENAYHVLENIAEWKKPKVEGVAVKAVDRKAKSSRYTRKSAPQAMQELVDDISSRLIVVSYNNMEKKGNARSNAKISGDELREILETKGTVEVRSIGFQAFTTGKTNLDDHRELLYVCHVGE